MESNASQDGRYAPPQAEVDDVVPGDGAGAPATRGTRLGAAVIDGLLAAAALWLVSKFTPWNPWDTTDFSYWRPQLGNMLGGVVIFLLLQGYLLATRGQTIGKYLTKIRIVRSDGSAATPGRIIGLRYGVGFIAALIPAIAQVWGLLDALFIFRASRKCLHDSIADTIVVKLQ